MSKVIRVRYEKGVLKPLEPLELMEGEEVQVILKTSEDSLAKRLYGVAKKRRPSLPRSTARHYRMLRRMYKETGAQGVLWYLVAKVYRDGTGFTELKKAYELIRGSPVRKATIAKILKRMTRKGLIKKDGGREIPSPSVEARGSLQQDRQE